MSRLEEIETRLGALPAPAWEIEGDEIIRRWNSEGADTLLCYRFIPAPGRAAQFRSEADLIFAAAAPDDVRWLLARVKALEAGLARIAEDYDHDCTHALTAQDTLDAPEP